MTIEYLSGSQRLQAPDVLWTTHAVCNDHSDLASNTSKEYVCLGGGMVPGLTSSDTHVYLKVIDGTFHNGAYLVKRDPFLRIPLDAGEHAQVHILGGIGGTAFFGTAAGDITITDPFTFYHVDFGATPFDAVGSSFFTSDTTITHGKGRIIGTGGITVNVVTDFLRVLSFLGL